MERYDESDRGFLKGLLGDEAGEREYQKRVANVNAQNAANTRKQNELLNAFQGSQFESLLKPSTSYSAYEERFKNVQNSVRSAPAQGEYLSVLQPTLAYNVDQFSGSKMASTGVTNSVYDNAIKENAKMNDKPAWNVRRSSNIIKKNAGAIKGAATKYGVNPSIIAACIYSEQMLNYNLTDLVKDRMYWDNPSVGIGQVAIETAKTIEKNTDIEKIKYLGKKQDWHGNNFAEKDAWYIPGYGTFLGTQEQAISKRLNIDEQCVEYVAAYLKLIQDLWREKYPIIDGKTDILATLYNIGEYGGKKGINSNPEPNPFGNFAKANYYYMQYLLGL